MGNWEVVDQILEYIPGINFDNTTSEVSLFETTIRYLGGLLSGRLRVIDGDIHLF
jgi:mannosyl-oligosaccharide alpha-1,2-mannosidase